MPFRASLHKPKGYSERKKQIAIANNKSESHAFYCSTAWRKLRTAIIQQQPLCVQCLKDDITTAAQVVDHIIPISKGGERLDETNCQPLCHVCHNKKRRSER